MKALYRGIVCHVTGETTHEVILDHEVSVPYGNLSLVIDPTDAQIAAADAGEEIPLDEELHDWQMVIGVLASLTSVDVDEWTERYRHLRRVAIQRPTIPRGNT